MENINTLLNTTAAGLIAQKLDARDEDGKDEKISVSIWKEFAGRIGMNENIDESKPISVIEAMNLIKDYAVKLAKSAGLDADVLTKKWLKQENEIDDEDKIKDANEKFTSKSIVVNVPDANKKIPNLSKIVQSRREGKDLHASLKNGITAGLTKENVSYALGIKNDFVYFGPNSQKQAKVVFELLVKRMVELKIYQQIDTLMADTFLKLPPKNQNKMLHRYKKRIIEAENRTIQLAKEIKQAKEEQKVFNDANSFLISVANKTEEVKIERGTLLNKQYASATLSDGRYIEVLYDNNGEISEIKISHNTDKNQNGLDLPVTYSKNAAFVSTDTLNQQYDGILGNNNYNFEQLIKIAQSIFE